MPSRTRYLHFLPVPEEKGIPHAASRTFVLALGLALRLLCLCRCGRVYELEQEQRESESESSLSIARLRLGKFKEWLETVGCRLNIPGH